jgi:hypothetical protein
MSVGSRLLDSVSRAFDYVERFSEAEVIKALGPFAVRLLFSSPLIANSYVRSLLSPRSAVVDLSIAVLGARDIDLSALIPIPAEKGRVFSGVGYTALWYAGQLPILYVFDHERRRGLVWLPKDAAPYWELTRPACPLFQTALQGRQWIIIHAAAVGLLNRLVLFGGKGRSGKTTAALACARAGWDYAGDDYVLANCSTCEVEPLYSSARLRTDLENSFADILPANRTVSHDDGEERYELNVSDVLDPARIKGGKLTAILLPRRKGAALPQFERARASDGFHALLLDTSRGAYAPMKYIAEKLSTLLGRVPVFFADTGKNPSAIPTSLEAFMTRL